MSVVNMMEKQKAFCKEKGLPFFAPDNGVCWSCGKIITDQGNSHITGCEHCSRSYCD